MNINDISKLEKIVGANALCINDYNQRHYVFSLGAVRELNNAFDRFAAENDRKDAEIARLTAENERLRIERNLAIYDIKQSCETCKHRNKKSCPWTNETVASTGQKVGLCGAWQWRGVQEGAAQ